MFFSRRRRNPPAAQIEAAKRSAVAEADRFRDAGRITEAADAYRNALALAPERADLRVQLGNMLKDSGRFAEAVAAYDEAARARPDDADIQLQRGRALKLAGQTQEAVAAFRAALALDPGLDAAADELGRLADIEAGETRLRSSFDTRGPVQVSGWAFDPRRPEQPITFDVEIDGVLYMRLCADLPRPDLRRIVPSINGGGFSFALPAGNGPAQIRLHADGQDLRGSPFPTTLRTPAERFVPRYAASPTFTGKAHGRLDPAAEVVIIVPVYGAPLETEACIEAVIAWTDGPARLLVIDDASPDPATAKLLDRYAGRSGVTIERNRVNLGYTATVNRGIALAGAADIVLLNSDTAVGPRWLDLLRQTACSAPDVASVTAVSDNAGAFTLPEPDRQTQIPEGWQLVDLQRLAAQASACHWPDVITGSGFCLYLRRAALEAVGAFDAVAFPRGYGEENDWCMRALKAGWRHLVDDRVLVHHARSASFGTRRAQLTSNARAALAVRHPEYAALVADFHKSPGLADARRRLRAALAAPRRPRPRILYVVSSETGGTPQTNRDLMRAVSAEYEPLLLHCDARVMTLSRPAFGTDSCDEILARHELAEPISFARHVSCDYDRQLCAWLSAYAVEFVHIRHLAWHSLNLPAIAQGMGLPTLLSFHDFYAACPTVKLLDETSTYCGARCTATTGDCVPDLWRLAATPPLKNQFVHVWRTRFASTLQSCDAFVTTSASARKTLISAFPDLACRHFEIIPHGRDFDHFAFPRRAVATGTLDILVPGNLSPAKGRDIVAALAARDQGRRLRFHLLGEVNPHLEGPGVIVHGPYRRSEFLARALETKAVIGAVFSVWPETYCHTLTEMWAAGLPVAAFDFGAVADRIRATDAGWILPHDDLDALYHALVALGEDPGARAAKASRVVAWQAGEGMLNTCATMASHYRRLYAELSAARRAFTAA